MGDIVVILVYWLGRYIVYMCSFNFTAINGLAATDFNFFHMVKLNHSHDNEPPCLGPKKQVFQV